jgi:hypothetical protein
MKKRHRRKPKSIIESRAYQKEVESNIQPTSPPKVNPKELKEAPTKPITFGKGWKEVWAYLGPCLSLVGAWFLLTPNIDVTAGINLDTAQQFQTQFLVSNRGHVPIYNVHFACGLTGPVVAIDSIRGSEYFSPISELRPGAIASRGCFGESRVPISGPLEISVFYTWPLIGKESVVKADFTVRQTASGFAMVPDTSTR